MQEMKSKLHYQFSKTKIIARRHKQHFGLHFEFGPWDGHQMVNIEFLFYILV
jgi:hypothetical protein